jgi:hypothetical protein
MKPILNVIINNMFFWGVVGGLLASVFILLQKHSLNHIDPGQTQKVLTQTMAQSALRVVISVGVLFLAFKTGLRYGIACLVVYILIRWIWMFAYLHKMKKGKEKE